MGSEQHVSCWDFKKALAKLAPQFYGFTQQDAQELLQYLLDGLHEDLNTVKKKPFIENKQYDEKEEEEVAAREQWANYLKRN